MKPYLPAIVILILFLAAWGAQDLFRPRSRPTPPAQSAIKSGQQFSLAQISQHRSAASCYTAIDGQVYDITKFINAHPGGEAILNGCGRDASASFHAVDSHQGPGATNVLIPYLIGTLK